MEPLRTLAATATTTKTEQESHSSLIESNKEKRASKNRLRIHSKPAVSRAAKWMATRSVCLAGPLSGLSAR